VQVGVMRVLYRAQQHNMMELLRNVSALLVDLRVLE
jgi:hypothetical protein